MYHLHYMYYTSIGYIGGISLSQQLDM